MLSFCTPKGVYFMVYFVDTYIRYLSVIYLFYVYLPKMIFALNNEYTIHAVRLPYFISLFKYHMQNAIRPTRGNEIILDKIEFST